MSVQRAAGATAQRALRFGAHGTLVGVLAGPDQRVSQTAVVILNAGLIHHVGPHRWHVQLARALAAEGLTSLRFDFSGIGDSAARPDNLPIFEIVEREPREAMDELARHGCRRFVLLGICSGAYSAFRAAAVDERVIAAVLINPQDFTAGDAAGVESQAWARRYWTRSILRPRAWLNLLSGRVDYRRLLGTLGRQFSGAARAASPALRAVQTRINELAAGGRVALLFAVSEDDLSLDYLALLLGRPVPASAGEGQGSGAVRVERLPGADHLFTRIEDQQRLTAVVLGWLRTIIDPAAR